MLGLASQYAQPNSLIVPYEPNFGALNIPTEKITNQKRQNLFTRVLISNERNIFEYLSNNNTNLMLFNKQEKD